MIKGINGGRFVQVQNGFVSDPYISPGAIGAGIMRWNPNMNCMEVSDGNSWKSFVTTVPTIELTPEANEVLDWAKKKMQEEKKIDGLCEKYPGLGKARDNFETFLRLVESEESIPNS